MTGQNQAPPQARPTAAAAAVAALPPTRASSIRSSPVATTYPEQPSSGPIVGGGLSCPPSRLAEISSRPHTAVNAPASLESQIQESAYVLPSSVAVGYNREDALAPGSFSGPLNPPVLFPRPHSATADILSRSSNNISFSPDKHMTTIEAAPRTPTERPETAMLFNRPDTAEALPPRRELPFQRLSEPRSSGSDTVRSPDRPSTGLMGPPALPSRTPGGRPGSSRSASSKAFELPPLPKPTVVEKTARGKQGMQQPPRTPTQDQNIFQRAKTSPYNGIENQQPFVASSSSPTSSPLSFARSSSAAVTSPNLVGTSSTAAAPNVQRTLLQNTLATPPASEATYSIPIAPDAGGAGGRSDTESLLAYTMQSDEGRRAALNEFVFRHLESDDFLTLVEDMETAWARVALGL
ncbi:hypothetical protein DDE82_003820 [Stemphylium lycopersici]|nr:hypothetical protein DDE82_003820 [Stemphylium lycopersici]